MKNYKKLLEQYDANSVIFIDHEWGQSPTGLYNVVVKTLNQSNISKVLVKSYKHFGIKKCTEFMVQQGLSCATVGKCPGGLRVIECQKLSTKPLLPIKSERNVKFKFLDKEYSVNIGETVFSKNGVDDGTHFLLEVILKKELELSGKKIADFGSGWGAISIILSTKFPKAKITAYEKEDSAFEASRENLKDSLNASVIKANLTDINSPKFVERRNKFDYIISNPPFHASEEDKKLIFKNAFNLLAADGKLIFVVEHSFESRFSKHIKALFNLEDKQRNDTYTVFTCSPKLTLKQE